MDIVIVAHADLAGVFLWIPGRCGNLPFQDEASAIEHAKTIAGDRSIAIQRQTGRRRRAFPPPACLDPGARQAVTSVAAPISRTGARWGAYPC